VAEGRYRTHRCCVRISTLPSSSSSTDPTLVGWCPAPPGYDASQPAAVAGRHTQGPLDAGIGWVCSFLKHRIRWQYGLVIMTKVGLTLGPVIHCFGRCGGGCFGAEREVSFAMYSTYIKIARQCSAPKQPRPDRCRAGIREVMGLRPKGRHALLRSAGHRTTMPCESRRACRPFGQQRSDRSNG
jgi:hypothetical protein